MKNSSMPTPTSSATAISPSISQKYQLQKSFFASGKTREISFRLKALKRLKAAIRKHEDQLLDALYSDFHKPPFESYASEVGFIYQEIKHTLANLNHWAKPPKNHLAPLALFLSRSRVTYHPKGLTLILGPWNYPFQLIMAPLIASVSAGNCALVKTSSQTPATAATTAAIIAESFEPGHVTTLQLPGREVIPRLIDPHLFQHIFFTGSTAVGKRIMEAAARQLCPVTLELGGKSPCIVDDTVPLQIAAKRIAWGKTFNGGQTCVAPDYLLVKKNVKDELVRQLADYFRNAFGESPQTSPYIAHIINKKRFQALIKLLEGQKILYGGRSWPEQLFIEPTLIDEPDLDSPLMQEEIFGPLLPVISWETPDELKQIIARNPYPLAFYLFSKNKKLKKELTQDIPFGGGCINNTLVHLADPDIPFGGFQTSGLGAYHGKDGFETFSHKKSILQTSFWPDLPFVFPPYGKWKEKIVRFFLS